MPMDSQTLTKTVKRIPRNGAPHKGSSNKTLETQEFSRALLAAMLSFREGNFTVRLPSDLVGVDGKIADVFNEIAAISENRARETVRVAHTVGKEGKLKQRMSLT